VKKYEKYLSVGSIFKNEATVLNEWVLHYLNRNVDHLYLIDDSSEDEYMDILSSYINDGYITLYKNDVPRIKNRQVISYNKFFNGLNQKTNWLVILDIDEYMYSPVTPNLLEVFKQFEHVGQLEINWLCFGSNGHINQPTSVVGSFTKRATVGKEICVKTPHGYATTSVNGYKTAINHNFNLHYYEIHKSCVDGPFVNVSLSSNSDPILLINHYITMSEEYWRKVKMTRGDADCYFPDTARDMEYFKIWDLNDVEDLALIKQNIYYNLVF
jgi:hypothetical protein